MRSMKKTYFTLLLLAVLMTAKAQQPQFFHNRAEYLTCLLEQPADRLLHKSSEFRRVEEYTQKLDSVIGSDDFDWSRWKNVYAYQDSIMEETSYVWQNLAWVPTTKTETDNSLSQEKIYRWTDEGWEHYLTVSYKYTLCGDATMLESVTTERLDSVWVNSNYSTYEYDEQCNLVLNMNYNGMNAEGEWNPSSKYAYTYVDGHRVSTLYSTIRNGNWRESSLDSLSYNEQGQCVSLTNYRKGGWGPGSNTWRVSSRYELTYEEGILVSELAYASGWGSDLFLDSRNDFLFDANGNELKKTASVYNESDWIVRDACQNSFDLSVDAATVLGLDQVWTSTLNQGMGYATGNVIPLNNLWKSCSINTSARDTEFALYCSGFEGVDEAQTLPIKAWSNHGCLWVENESQANITVFDLLGRVVASEKQTMHCEFSLNPGLYIVSNGNARIKVVVK